jgi:hypothetical protein
MARPTKVVHARAAGSATPQKCEVVDPFQESFDEEELVLDRFAALGSAFGDATPRVRSCDPNFAHMVEQAIESGHPNLDCHNHSLDRHLPSTIHELSTDDLASLPNSHDLPAADEDEAVIQAEDGDEILIVEDDATGDAVKVGSLSSSHHDQVQCQEFSQLFSRLQG